MHHKAEYGGFMAKTVEKIKDQWIYRIQQKTGEMQRVNKNRREETVILSIRFGQGIKQDIIHDRKKNR